MSMGFTYMLVIIGRYVWVGTSRDKKQSYYRKKSVHRLGP